MNPSPSPSLFRTAAPILIAVAVAAVCARILNTELVLEPHLHRNADEPNDGRRVWPEKVPTPMPTFSSNDRSRWATVRALVDEGTFAIGHRDAGQSVFPAIAASLAGPDPFTAARLVETCRERASLLKSKGQLYGDSGIIFEDGWQSVDKVLKPTPHDGVYEFYSSKPPLFSTLIAALYWVVKAVTSWTLQSNPWGVVRTILLLVNALPFVIYLLLLVKLIDRLGTSDWGKLFVLAAAGFGTFVTTFAMTLNNHSPAAYALLFALAAVVPLWSDGGGAWWRFALAGFFASFAAAVELPAASLAALLFALLLVRFPRQTLLFALPAMLIPVAAWFLTNYLAIGQWKPAYAEFGRGPWYEYDGSHWNNPPRSVKPGIDWASTQEGRGAYVFHFFIGHHGWFSLTPVWLLSLAALAVAFRRRLRTNEPTPPGQKPSLLSPLFHGAWPSLYLLTAAVSVIVMGFYLTFQERWNYGGWTSGPRWLIWLTPLWLLALLPAADWLARRRWGRCLGYILLGVSVFSATYPAWNPWRHPWLYNWLETWGLIPY